MREAETGGSPGPCSPAEAGISTGCRTDRFCPSAVVTRGQMAIALAQYRHLDDRMMGPSGGRWLVVVIGPEIGATDRVRLGKSVAQSRLGAAKAFLQPLDVGHRPRRAAGGDIG